MNPFTTEELFITPPVVIPSTIPGGRNPQLHICNECGAYVALPAIHVDFHNKIADL